MVFSLFVTAVVANVRIVVGVESCSALKTKTSATRHARGEENYGSGVGALIASYNLYGLIASKTPIYLLLRAKILCIISFGICGCNEKYCGKTYLSYTRDIIIFRD